MVTIPANNAGLIHFLKHHLALGKISFIMSKTTKGAGVELPFFSSSFVFRGDLESL